MADHEKEAKLQVAYEIIGRLDDSVAQTVWLDKAIEALRQLKDVRENMPF